MYEEFIDRVSSAFSSQIWNVPKKWNISAPLRDKVSSNGDFLPFYGYTSVFRLSKEDRNICRSIQERLFEKNGDMFVVLPCETFHVTAHEYANVYTVSKSMDEIDEENNKVMPLIRSFFCDLYDRYRDTRITLKALGPSSNGSDVVSIKFIPDSKDDCALLEYIFDKSEQIWPVGKKYTPHVSLGYFKLQEFSRTQIDSLYSDMQLISKTIDYKVSFSVGDLVFQRHFDMKDFRGLFTVSDMEPGKCVNL